MTRIKKTYLILKDFCIQTRKDNIRAFSAQAAFFLFLSLFPFFSLLLGLIQFLPVTESELIKTVIDLFPKNFESVVTDIVTETYAHSTGTLISISAIMTLWSSSQGVLAIIYGLNSAYRIEEKRNYIHLRVVSVLYTIGLLATIVSTLLIIVFSNSFFSFFKKRKPLIAEIIAIVVNNKFVLTFCILFLYFIFIYKIVKKSEFTFANILPGALFATLGWILFSFFFSIYVEGFANYSYTYGSISAFVVLMLWLYICMYILFLGAEINNQLSIYLINIFAWVFGKQ